MSDLYDLPNGWEWKKLIDVVQIGCDRGFTPTITDGKVPFIGMSDIDENRGRETEFVLEDFSKVSKGKTKFQRNAVLVGKITPCTQNNKISIVPSDIDGGFATTEVYALHSLDGMYPLFLNFYIRSNKINEHLVNSMIGATGRQRVPSDTIKKLDIPLPPLTEQQRIVSKLDKLFEKIDKAIALHQKNIDEAEAFMGSALNEVFGELEGKYDSDKLANIINVAQYGFSHKASEDGQYPFLRMGDLQNGKILYDNLKYVNLSDKDYEKYNLKKYDILFNRTNSFELVGKTSIFEEDIDMFFASYLIRVRANEQIVIPYYLNYFMNSKNTQSKLKEMATKAVNQSNINAQKLKSISSPIPPLNIQQKVVTYLDDLSEKIEKVKSIQKEKMDSLTALKSSILDKAFRGEL